MGFEMRKKERFEKAEKFVERIKEVQGEAKAALTWYYSVLRTLSGKWLAEDLKS